MQVLWSRRTEHRIQGGLLLVIGVLDVTLAAVTHSVSTLTRYNMAIFGIIVLIFAVGLLRTRVFLDDQQIGVRNLWVSRSVLWTKIDGVVVSPRQVTLVRDDVTTVVCMALSPNITKPDAQAAIDTVRERVNPSA